MPAFSFNAQQFTPSYGGHSQLPPGKYKGIICESHFDKSQKGGGFLALTLQVIDGPLAGQRQIDRLNLYHHNPQTVQIANGQLSAYCYVVGVLQFAATEELHNKPFMFEIGWQKGQEPSEANPAGGYTEVKAILDANGNPAGKGHQSAPQAAPATPPAPPPPPMPPQAPSGPPQGQPGQQWGQPPAAPPAAPSGPPPAAPFAGAPFAAAGAPPAAPPAAPQQWQPPAAGAPPAGAPPAWGGPPASGPPAWGQQ